MSRGRQTDRDLDRGVLDAELLAAFGHELLNQLNAVVGAAGLLHATTTSADDHELASIVLKGSEQVVRLVDEVLDAAVIQSGGFELALHPFDVRSSVETCLGLLAEPAEAKDLDLSFRADPDVPSMIIGDSRRVEQILLALVRGAIERTDRGGVGVELSCQPAGARVALRFKVRDTGKPLPARILHSGPGGAGPSPAQLDVGERLAILSLATSKRLVEMMDGELHIEHVGTEAGSDTGTEFDFTILAEALPSPLVSAALSLDGMRVLVITADAAERRVLALQAELWGAPATAATAAEGIQLVQAGHPFDVVLVEHRRPVIDGIAISNELRTLRGSQQLPIVLIAKEPLGEEEASAADSGLVQATLTKPVPHRKLHDVLAQVSAHKPAAPTTPTWSVPGALRVLVAEDNALNQSTLRRLVTKLGHQANVVANGREAVAAVAQDTYDAVLMDILMPDMGGIAAVEEICRRWPRGARPRLIALTALAGPGDRERCLQAGFDDYMSKPVHLDELAEALKAAAGWRVTQS